MVNLTFSSGDKEIVINTNRFTFDYEAIPTLMYRTRILFRNSSENLYGFLSNNTYIKVFIGNIKDREMLTAGVLTGIEIKISSDIPLTEISITNKLYDLLLRSTHETEMKGDFAREMDKVLETIGARSIKTYSGNVPLYRVQKGYIYDTLRRISIEKGIQWNVSGSNLYIGNILSLEEYNFNSRQVRINTSYFKSDDGRNVKKRDLSTKYFRRIDAGDRVRIDDSIYHVGRVKHSLRMTKRNIIRKTSLVLLSNLSDLEDYIRINDEDDRINDVINSSIDKVYYDIDLDEVIYYDSARGLWLGEMHSIVFSCNNAGPLTEYLKVGEVVTTDSLGYCVLCEICITNVTLDLSGTDDANIEILVDGKVVYSIPICNTSCCIDQVTVLSGGGIISARYVPGPTASGTSDIICMICFRKVGKYE